MEIPDKEILLITKGHPYEREPFYAIFDGLAGVNWTLVEQPAAQALCQTEFAQDYSAYVFYDMPGIQFKPGGAPVFTEPPESYKTRLQALIEQGHGFVFLHHAIAGWPAWPEYAEIIGGRFLYMADELRGKHCADSGYRHGVTHTVDVVADHPVTKGLPESFSITDELYLYEVFADDVEPLLTSRHDFVAENFYSATLAVRDGKMFSNEGWTHPPGSNLIGWTRTLGRSRIVYLQCGDDPVAYANPHFQQLVANAIDWVSQHE
jgi:type 1 glutamine amidotransferase